MQGGMDMWICPKCGREFKKTNQDHYCGKAPENIDAYIASQSPHAQKHLSELRNVIRSCIPQVKERIAWSMPVFENGKCSISMAAFQKHISFYVDAETIEYFLRQTTLFSVKKNAIYFPYDKELPKEIVEAIVKQHFQNKEEAKK